MFRAFSLAAAVGAFLLAVLGSWVRINGAGMTCPDWPLCHGQLLPSLAGGVIFEWSHRLVAFGEGFLVLGALWSAWRERARIAGVSAVMGFIAVLFGLQVLFGGLTVFVSNSPWSVVLHWGTAMLFLAGLTALALLAVVRPRRLALRPSRLGARRGRGGAAGLRHHVRRRVRQLQRRRPGLRHLAGLRRRLVDRRQARPAAPRWCTACAPRRSCWSPRWPRTWPRWERPPRVRVAVLFGYALVVLQVMLGFANVAWLLPTLLREAHAANAGATFLAFVAALVFAAIDGTEPHAARSSAPGRAGGPAPLRVTR